MADYHIDYLFDYDDSHEMDPEDENSEGVVCNRCGTKFLKWIKTTDGWRTSKNGIVHICPKGWATDSIEEAE